MCLKWVEENAESEYHILIPSEMKTRTARRILNKAKSLYFLQLLK